MILKRLIHGSFWATSEKIASIFLGLASYFLLAHLLPPNEMGAYFLTMSVVMLASVLAQLGLNQTVVRLIAESMGKNRVDRARAAVRMVFIYAALGALVIGVLLLSGVGGWIARELFHSDLMAGVILPAVVIMVLFTFQGLLGEAFRGFHDIRFASLFGGLFSTLVSVFLFFILWVTEGKSTITEIMILSIAGGVISNGAAALILGRKVGGFAGKRTAIAGREIFTIAWPILVTNLTLFALNQMSLWIVGAFQPENEVAVYGAALRFALLLEKPLLIANAFLPPIIAEMYVLGKTGELERIIRAIAGLISIPAFMLLLGFVCFGESLLGIVFGDFYRQGAALLIILGAGQFVNVWAGSCGVTLLMTGNQKYMMGITICCGILGTIAALWAVRDHGAMGVAVASSVSLIIQNLLMVHYVRKKTGIRSFASFSLSAFRAGLKADLREQPANA